MKTLLYNLTWSIGFLYPNRMSVVTSAPPPMPYPGDHQGHFDGVRFMNPEPQTSAPPSTSHVYHFRPGQKPSFQAGDPDFDGRKLRRTTMRKTVDYNSSIIRELEVKNKRRMQFIRENWKREWEKRSSGIFIFPVLFECVGNKTELEAPIFRK